MLFTKKSISYILSTFILMIITTLILFHCKKTISIVIYTWDLTVRKSLHISYRRLFDWVSTVFLVTLITITLAVSLFSHKYISLDKNQNQFLFTLATFVASIIFFIPRNNFLIIILGWDGLGISSFILIIYYQTPKALFSGIVTRFTNRIGDALILASLAVFFLRGSRRIANNQRISSTNPTIIILLLLITVARFTKSAQIPFSSWLPAAIAAPTPVSALVHSSTLVTAGVYLIVRITMIFSIPPYLSIVVILIALITATIAGVSACFEIDVKKLIALSTLSQLGVIIFRISIQNYTITFFHLVSHARFKALLFISAGWVLVIYDHKQDIRDIGELNIISNSALIIIIIASISLIALPFLSGFFSKDIILETYFISQFSIITIALILISTIITSIYSLNLLILTHANSLNHPPLLKKLNQPIFHNIGALILAMGRVTLSSVLVWNIIPIIAHPTILPEIKHFLTIILLTAVLTSFLYLNSINRLTFDATHILEFNSYIGNLTPLSHSLVANSSNKLSYIYIVYVEEIWIHQLTSNTPLNILILISNKTIQFKTRFNLILIIVLFLITLISFCFNSLKKTLVL